MIDHNFNLSICRVKLNRQIRNLKITKLKQQVMPTYCHIDSTDVIDNHYICHKCQKTRAILILHFKARFIHLQVTLFER
jgi:hypothetical protein